jgi:hypothetical protein
MRALAVLRSIGRYSFDAEFTTESPTSANATAAFTGAPSYITAHCGGSLTKHGFGAMPQSECIMASARPEQPTHVWACARQWLPHTGAPPTYRPHAEYPPRGQCCLSARHKWLPSKRRHKFRWYVGHQISVFVVYPMPCPASTVRSVCGSRWNSLTSVGPASAAVCGQHFLTCLWLAPPMAAPRRAKVLMSSCLLRVERASSDRKLTPSPAAARLSELDKLRRS